MALSATSKNQIAALIAVLADQTVQKDVRDAAGRLAQPNVLPLIGSGHGNHLTSTQATAVATALSTLAADVAAN
jgi:hypothetical protein